MASQTDVATFSHRFMIQRVKTRHTRRAPTSGNEIPVRVHVVNAACRKSVASDRIRAAALAMIGKKRVPPRAALSSARTALAARPLAVRSRLLFGSMPNRPHRVGLAGGGGGGEEGEGCTNDDKTTTFSTLRSSFVIPSPLVIVRVQIDSVDFFRPFWLPAFMSVRAQD